MKQGILNLIVYEISKNSEGSWNLSELIHRKRPTRNKFGSLFTLLLFIGVFIFYYQINLLMAFFVLLLFIYWYLRSDINLIQKRYSRKNQRIKCFNDAQMLLHKGKYQEALSVLQEYQGIYQDEEALKLYAFVLFILGEYEKIENLIHYIDEMNDGFKLLMGIVYEELGEHPRAEEYLTECHLENDVLLTIRILYLTKTSLNLNKVRDASGYCEWLMEHPSKYVELDQEVNQIREEVSKKRSDLLT